MSDGSSTSTIEPAQFLTTDGSSTGTIQPTQIFVNDVSNAAILITGSLQFQEQPSGTNLVTYGNQGIGIGPGQEFGSAGQILTATGDPGIIWSTPVTISIAPGFTGNFLFSPADSTIIAYNETILTYTGIVGSTGTISANSNNLIDLADVLPAASNVYSLGTTTQRWKDLFIGPGTLNIGGPEGASAGTIGSDLAGIVYARNGFASSTITVGPESSDVIGAVGGYRLSSELITPGPTAYDFKFQQNIATGDGPAGLTGPEYSLIEVVRSITAGPGITATQDAGATSSHIAYQIGLQEVPGVTGSYIYPASVAVNQYGQVTSIASGAGITGPQGSTGATGAPGSSSTLVLFMDSSGGAIPDNNGQLLVTPTVGAQQSLATISNGQDQLIGSFTTPVGSLTSTLIAGGEWDMNIFAICDNSSQRPTCYFKVYDISNGTSILIADGSGNPIALEFINSSILQNIVSLYVPTYVLADLSHRIRVDLYANIDGNNHAIFYFRGATQSHIHTTIVGNAGLQGPPGPTGQSISWIAGGTYAETNAGITAINTLITYDEITPSSITARYLVMGSITSITGDPAGSLYGTLARGSAFDDTAFNLANSANQPISAGITDITGHMAATYNAINTLYTLSMSVVDQPGTTGPIYYSLWVYSDSEASDPQNSMLTVLQVAP